MAGAQGLDRLLGTSGRAETVRALLRLDPVVGATSVRDGREFLADKRADHPDGVPVERWGPLVRRLRNTVGVLAGLALLVLQLGGPGVPQQVAGTALSALGLVGIVLIWVTSSWRAIVVAGDARYAVRWAADRPGQVERGLPVAEPFGGFRSTVLIFACVVVALAVFLLAFWVKVLLDGTDYLPQVSIFVAAVWLVGVLLIWLYRALGRAQQVANEHLFLLADDEKGLRVDASTIVAERYLVLSAGPLSASSFFGGVLVEERTIYPLTVHLSADELQRRYEEVSQNLDLPATWVGEPTQAPVVTVHEPRQESSAPSRWESAYAGGWCLAVGTVAGSSRPGWLIVREDPQRFIDQVLPLLDERSGFAPGSLTVMEPEPVGEDRWFREFVAARESRSS